jgi:hypothetical protein
LYVSSPKATRSFEPNSYKGALLSTLLHATVYVYTQFAECTGTDCKLIGIIRKIKEIIQLNAYSSPSIIRIIKARRMRWVGHVARIGEKRNAYRLLVGKPERRSPLGRPRRRWVDNIRMDLVEVGWGDVDSIGLAQDRGRWRALVNSVLDLRIP